jgi:hypothetical protein
MLQRSATCSISKTPSGTNKARGQEKEHSICGDGARLLESIEERFFYSWAFAASSALHTSTQRKLEVRIKEVFESHQRIIQFQKGSVLDSEIQLNSH